MSLTAGSSLAHDTILGPLGAGAMGEVYRVRDAKLGREVAIKGHARAAHDLVATRDGVPERRTS